MDEGLPSIHHPSTLKGLNLPQTQSCHRAPHLARLVSQVLNIPSFGDLVLHALTGRTEMTPSGGYKPWKVSLELRVFSTYRGSLFITAPTWIMQGQTIVDISLRDSTSNCYTIWLDGLFVHLLHYLDSNYWVGIQLICKRKGISEFTVTLKMMRACGHNRAHFIPAHFGDGAVYPFDFDLKHCLGFWLSVSCSLFVLAMKAGAAKLLSQLNNGGLQGLMGSLINGCQWSATRHHILLATVDKMVDLTWQVKIWVMIK